MVLQERYCPSCEMTYSLAEFKNSSFCPKCGKFLTKKTIVKKKMLPAITDQIDDKESFVRNIYQNMQITNNPLTECDRCFTKFNFSRLQDFNFKPCFPPVGSSKTGQVLFVAINPRCKPGSNDEDFYRHALANEENFLQFSQDGKYKTSYGYRKKLFNDRHYSIHQQCLSKIDPSWRLGVNSSVAELFMCGKESTEIFSKIENPLLECICAREYLIKYIELIKPKVIVTLGRLPLRWFQSKFGENIKNSAKRLDKNSSHELNFLGNPNSQGIKKLHSCFAKIRLESGHISQIIFSGHPGKWMSNVERKKLLQTFSYVAKPLLCD